MVNMANNFKDNILPYVKNPGQFCLSLLTAKHGDVIVICERRTLCKE